MPVAHEQGHAEAGGCVTELGFGSCTVAQFKGLERAPLFCEILGEGALQLWSTDLK
jgi:hypothetical protein